jgi:hypothetical protein
MHIHGNEQRNQENVGWGHGEDDSAPSSHGPILEQHSRSKEIICTILAHDKKPKDKKN